MCKREKIIVGDKDLNNVTKSNNCVTNVKSTSITVRQIKPPVIYVDVVGREDIEQSGMDFQLCKRKYVNRKTNLKRISGLHKKYRTTPKTKPDKNKKDTIVRL